MKADYKRKQIEQAMVEVKLQTLFNESDLSIYASVDDNFSSSSRNFCIKKHKKFNIQSLYN